MAIVVTGTYFATIKSHQGKYRRIENMWRVALIFVLIAGCARETRPPRLETRPYVSAPAHQATEIVSSPPRRLTQGEVLYWRQCADCHGLYGRGNGRAVAALATPPRDISAASYQNQMNDAELLHIVTEGKGAMPGAADVLGSQELHAVVAFMRILSPGYELYDRFCTACHGADGFPPTES